MANKILILYDAERNKSNTASLIKTFVDAAEAIGHNVTTFNTADMEIGGCHNCGKCFLTGKACCFDDDFNKIAPHLLDADAVVLAFPLYWFSFSAKFKAAFDKIYAFSVAKRNGSGVNTDLSGKNVALICCAKLTDPSIFDGVRIPYEKSIDYLNWTSVGEVYVSGLKEIGDICKTDGETRVAALAEKI